jgi:D-aminopeptidase
LKPRARDLGLPFKGQTGKWNAITDVPGVEVGYCTLQKPHPKLEVGVGPINTGVTAIFPRGKETDPQPVWASNFDLNGNGEMTGTHWINDAGYFVGPVCITNTHSVGMVHHATVGWMIDQYKGSLQDEHGWAMPVVAETYDGLSNDICGRHITEEHVLEAFANATRGPIAEGNVGGGTGMQTYDFAGGTGTSSRIVEIEQEQFTVGVVVQSNFGRRNDLDVLGVPVGEHMTDNIPLSDEDSQPREMGSIIVIIGTDLPLSSAQLRRLAKRGSMGVARTGTAGGHYSGDIMLAFSVANPIDMRPFGADQAFDFTVSMLNDAHCDRLFNAAVQAVEEAILNAMIAAETMQIVKPHGMQCDAIDHSQLVELMRKYNRIR